MKTSVVLLIVVTVTLSLWTDALMARAPLPSMTQAWQDAIERWAAAPGHRGVSASVILPDGTQWSGVAGMAGPGESLEPEHLIMIASITKTMTGALILQLVDEGVLYLDDSIGRWVAPPQNVDPRITVRQLLNHTSGLANYTDSPALGRTIADDSAHVFVPDELLGFVGPPRFPPGTQTQYTNTSFILLGQIAESATKRSIVDLYHHRLWDPLGLTEIFLPGVEPAPGPVAPALTSRGLVAPLEQMSLLSIGHSAFGLMATAETVAKWGHALFTGGVISPAMQEAMRTLVPAAGNIPGETGAGLGIRSYRYLERTQFGHSGGSAFGSSLMLYDPASGATVVVLMNQGQDADHFKLAPLLLEIATR